jgi:hypothetical protein
MGKKAWLLHWRCSHSGLARCYARTPAPRWLSRTAHPRRLQLRATTAAPCRVFVPPVRVGVFVGPAFGGYYGHDLVLRWPPILRPPRLLGRTSSSLALTNRCRGGCVSRHTAKA